MSELTKDRNNVQTNIISLAQFGELFEVEFYKRNFASNMKVEDMFKFYSTKSEHKIPNALQSNNSSTK